MSGALFLASGMFLGIGLTAPSLNTQIIGQETRINPQAAEANIIEGVSLEARNSEKPITSTEILNSQVKIPEELESYVYGKQDVITFGGGEIVFSKTNIALSRAFGSVGDALSVCMDGKCFNKCDHLAGDIWGYEEASGYLSAKTHWDTAVAQGIAVFDDREPPLGALLFWETGRPFGHVATYIGNGMVVTNAGGEYGSNVYIYYADWYDKIGYNYLGWAPPVFFGEEPGSAL